MTVDTDLTFTQSEINNLVKTQQDFIEGKTTARDWEDIEKDLQDIYDIK